ncbi:malto-oligosyltrehalose trehalohydrolase [Flavitalea sp. BT771]|uniref:malto-oligosyltrehalose trehalohydrolase n=1 Tax=Flavitalea sp. BT771 TaxID=3063329 RepID=UPI0026E1D09B|nr:malto-oligosyltrehalose trehalohydrolase [Flavitalea sp. BT771]MDO6434551.1 malto-oligosyltrehalose trehalohydrolase [Flavitalea sp. BT771]MDV6223451.1 malto-oligosyltrehalose trehalohydrolase [Flavitalea sp. BT771]
MNITLQKIGAWYDPAGSSFIVWAPACKKVELILESPPPTAHPMMPDGVGYWRITLPVPAGTPYRFRLNEENSYPDPASFHQPQGVHEPSVLVSRTDPSAGDEDWKGIPLSNMIIYELHTGCFSDTHDFDGIIRRLDYLDELGINTIELMPMGQCPGQRNWGYDGVAPFAIQHSYGGIRGFQRLVKAAHAKGIAVLVDVVYNHLGPEGNYLPFYGPYFSERYRTPWGSPLNFDGPWSDGVRNFFLQNARMWLEDYQVDGLRLDAVHAIYDFSACHFMQELKDLALDIETRTGRKKILIAEIDLNDPRYINSVEKGGYGLDGQWVDEFHHALRVLLTGERNAYYEDFGDITHLEKAFRHTYVYNGIYSQHRKKTFGGYADQHPFSQFVVFSQNHDQVGNRPMGDRLTHNVSFEQLKLAAATVLLSPYVPLLFMGEEYGEKNPFQFFTDFSDPALIEAVRAGRKKEFPAFAEGLVPPDPQSEETFLRSNLSWHFREGQGATLLAYYRHLIRLRKTRPALQGMTREEFHLYPLEGQTLSFERKILTDQVYVWLHFGDSPAIIHNPTGCALRKIFDSAAAAWCGPGEKINNGKIELQPYSAVVYEKIIS